MLQIIREKLSTYAERLLELYGEHVKKIILYGSYARGDFKSDSDIDIMILLDISDFDLKEYQPSLSDMTYDFNMDYDVDIKPIAKNIEAYEKWVHVYPFYRNIQDEGVVLYMNKGM